MSEREEVVVPTPDQLRAISHPVRVRLLGLLRMDGPQTSAELARATGLNTGATSYHLRQLAQHGFIVDAPGRGTGRERHWQARHRSTAAPATRPGAAEPTASLDDRSAWQQTIVSWTAGSIQAAHDEWTELPTPWREVTTFNDVVLRLTPERAAEVLSRLTAALLEEAAQHPMTPGEGSDEPEAELWQVHLMAFPVPGRLPHREDA